MNNGFFRVACCSPEIKVADCDYNAAQIIECVKNITKEGASCIVFPELCITGATCDDLFLQEQLLTSAFNALQKIAEETSSSPALFFAGLPFAFESKIFHQYFQKIFSEEKKEVWLLLTLHYANLIIHYTFL